MIEPEFKQWLSQTDSVILLCWDLGHIWNAAIYATIEKVAHGAHLLTGECERGCGVKRARYLTSSWSPDPSKNSYQYPKGYSPRGLFREGFFMDAEHRAAIRRELARRVAEDLAAQKRKQALSKSNGIPEHPGEYPGERPARHITNVPMPRFGNPEGR